MQRCIPQSVEINRPVLKLTLARASSSGGCRRPGFLDEDKSLTQSLNATVCQQNAPRDDSYSLKQNVSCLQVIWRYSRVHQHTVRREQGTGLAHGRVASFVSQQ